MEPPGGANHWSSRHRTRLWQWPAAVEWRSSCWRAWRPCRLSLTYGPSSRYAARVQPPQRARCGGQLVYPNTHTPPTINMVAHPPPPSQWYKDAATWLNQPPNSCHWWCEHTAVTQGLLELLAWHDSQPVVQQLWRQMAGQLAGCALCIQHYHQAQVCAQQSISSGRRVLNPSGARWRASWLAVRCASSPPPPSHRPTHTHTSTGLHRRELRPSHGGPPAGRARPPGLGAVRSCAAAGEQLRHRKRASGTAGAGAV